MPAPVSEPQAQAGAQHDRPDLELAEGALAAGQVGAQLQRLGVYAVEVDVLTGPHQGGYNGAASLGVRPMFGENQPNLETFLFDFAGDLYGEHLSVALVEYLRPEMVFDGLDALITQMNADCDRARSILAAL